MADTRQEETVTALRDEVTALRAQLENIVRNLGEKKEELAANAEKKLAAELEHYRGLARENLGRAYDAGSEGIEELSAQVRRNPIASLIAAFGAGCVLSWLLRKL